MNDLVSADTRSIHSQTECLLHASNPGNKQSQRRSWMMPWAQVPSKSQVQMNIHCMAGTARTFANKKSLQALSIVLGQMACKSLITASSDLNSSPCRHAIKRYTHITKHPTTIHRARLDSSLFGFAVQFGSMQIEPLLEHPGIDHPRKRTKRHHRGTSCVALRSTFSLKSIYIKI